MQHFLQFKIEKGHHLYAFDPYCDKFFGSIYFSQAYQRSK